MRVAVGLAGGFEVDGPGRGSCSSRPSKVRPSRAGPRGRSPAAPSRRRPPISQLPLALSLVPLHDLALHPGRHAGLPLPLLLDEQMQRRREDLLVGRSGLPCASPAFAFFKSARNSRETVTCILLDVAVIGSTTVRSTTDRSTPVRGAQSSPGRISGTVCFTSATGSTGRDVSTRVTTVLVGTNGPGLQLRRQFQRLLLGQAVESRKHRGQVLLRRHRGKDRRGGEAQLPFAYRLQHLGESLDQPGGGAPVMSRRAGELQPLVEIREEVRVAEGAEELSPVELGQGLEEGAQGDELDAEEVDEPGVEGAGLAKGVVVHERQCLTRFPGLLERTRIPAIASFRREISNLARNTAKCPRRGPRAAAGALPWPPLRGTRISRKPCQYSVR